LTVPVEVLRLLWSLEERGLRLSQNGDLLTVEPRSRLTPDDCEQIRRWKPHLLALISYTPPVVS
jgi:hypothetical protein